MNIMRLWLICSSLLLAARCFGQAPASEVAQPLDGSLRRVSGDTACEWQYAAEQITIGGQNYTGWGQIVDGDGDATDGWVALDVTGWERFTAIAGVKDHAPSATGEVALSVDDKNRRAYSCRKGQAGVPINIPLNGAHTLIIRIKISAVLASPTLHKENPLASCPFIPSTETRLNPKDDAELILIPAGSFLMGSTDTGKYVHNNAASPQHKVYLDAYYIYKNNVTLGQYQKFCAATGHQLPSLRTSYRFPDDRSYRPVGYINWYDAKAYADWAGVNLPTEAQWEKAARGTDGRIYPWGNNWEDGWWSHPDKIPLNTSPYGVLRMTGGEFEFGDGKGIFQWCADWYDSTYYQHSPTRNPQGPTTGKWRVMRGGNDNDHFRIDSRGSCYPKEKGGSSFGFRCVASAPVALAMPQFTPIMPFPAPMIKVFTTPPGATVYVNNEQRGTTTPTEITLEEIGAEARPVKVEVRLSGYQSARNLCALKAGSPMTQFQFSLEKIPQASITVTTDPPGAQVFVNDKECADTTPSEIKLDDIGAEARQVKVEVRLEGYQPAGNACTLKAGDPTHTFQFTLVKIPAPIISVTTAPPGATVSVNGKPREGITPMEITLDDIGAEARDFVVTVSLAGYQAAGDHCGLKAGDRHPFNFILERLAAPQPIMKKETRRNPKDDAEMILIPAGEFLMGSADSDKLASPTEKPQHTVYLDAYYIYKNDVTVAQYRKFCAAMGRQMPGLPEWSKDDHPVVNITWDDAGAYAQWAGASLPTEAQWEKAARGGDGRVFPWGNEWDAWKCSNSVGDLHPGKTSPVGSFAAGASQYGVLDMAGNVWQWCADWYDDNYYRNSPARNPTGPATGTARVLRGGGWYNFNAGNFRVACRSWYFTTGRYYIVGFRCVVPAPRP